MIAGALSGVVNIAGTLDSLQTIGGGLSLPSVIRDDFTGAYEYTPTSELQTIQIKDKTATENIIINPIPSNYGLITWNGSTLTVS